MTKISLSVLLAIASTWTVLGKPNYNAMVNEIKRIRRFTYAQFDYIEKITSPENKEQSRELYKALTKYNKETEAILENLVQLATSKKIKKSDVRKASKKFIELFQSNMSTLSPIVSKFSSKTQRKIRRVFDKIKKLISLSSLLKMFRKK